MTDIHHPSVEQILLLEYEGRAIQSDVSFLRAAMTDFVPPNLIQAIFCPEPGDTRDRLRDIDYCGAKTVAEFTSLLDGFEKEVALMLHQRRVERMSVSEVHAQQTGRRRTRDKPKKSAKRGAASRLETILFEEVGDDFFFPDPSAPVEQTIEYLRDAGLAVIDSGDDDDDGDDDGSGSRDQSEGREVRVFSDCQWVPPEGVRPNPSAACIDHEWFCAVYARAVFGTKLARALVYSHDFREERRHRAKEWERAQIGLVELYNSGRPFTAVAVVNAYTPMGPTYYPDTVDEIRVVHRRVPGRATVEQRLAERHPELCRPLDEDAPQLSGRGHMPRKFLSGVKKGKGWFCPFTVTEPTQVARHGLYIACQYRLYLLQRIRSDRSESPQAQDAAYLYQLAFLDLFEHCAAHGRYDDQFLMTPTETTGLSPWQQFYPDAERAFHEGDLPDLYPVLFRDIPVYGEKVSFKQSYIAGNIIRKCIPFASTHRSIWRPLRDGCMDPAFWPVASKAMWCALAGTYPGSTYRPDGPTALRIRQLVGNRDVLLSVLKPTPENGKHSAVLPFLDSFRQYVCYMATRVPLYAHICIQPNWGKIWDMNVRATEMLRRADFSRLQAVLDQTAPPSAVFTDYRVNRAQQGRAPRGAVYRYRSGALVPWMSKVFQDALHNYVFLDREANRGLLAQILQCIELIRSGGDWESGYRKLMRSPVKDELPDYTRVSLNEVARALDAQSRVVRIWIRTTRVSLSTRVKDSILNMVTSASPEMYFDIRFQRQLCLPEYGGLSTDTSVKLNQLYRVMRDAGKPSAINAIVDQFDSKHVLVLAWYWHWAGAMDKFRLVPLPASTVERIEVAMKRDHYRLYPGEQELTSNCYTARFTLCCKTMIGSNKRHSIRFDDDLGTMVCSKTLTVEPARFDLEPSVDPDEWKRRAGTQVNAFLAIPCLRQPVLSFNLRGRMLVVGNSRSVAMTHYMHCPRCAMLHQITPECFRTPQYECEECVSRGPFVIQRWSCAYCQRPVLPTWKYAKDGTPTQWSPPKTFIETARHLKGSDPHDPDWDPENDPMGVVERLCFCRGHFGVAKYAARRYDKAGLISVIGPWITKKRLENQNKHGV